MSESCIFIEPGKYLKGTVEINPSKSYCHRYLIFGALCILKGVTDSFSIRISSVCDDIKATLDCLEAMGICVRQEDGIMFLTKKDLPDDYVPYLFCRDSGTTLRFILPAAALIFDDFVISGSESLAGRPIAPFLNALEANGLRYKISQGSGLPVIGKGRLKDGKFILPGNISSQFISALLIALPFAGGNPTVSVTSGIQSMPYIEMTIQMLKEYGIFWEYSEDTGTFCLKDNGSISVPKGTVIPEGDWSSASFWICSNYLGSEIITNGLNPESLQGDRQIEGMLKMIAKRRLIDVSDRPDSFPAISVCAALKPGRTVFKGISRLQYKESNRIESVVSMIRNLGGEIACEDDRVTVYGKEILKGGTVDSFGDHRIAMAACIAASRTEEGVRLIGHEAVSKSYPSFYEDFEALGGRFYVCSMG